MRFKQSIGAAWLFAVASSSSGGEPDVRMVPATPPVSIVGETSLLNRELSSQVQATIEKHSGGGTVRRIALGTLTDQLPAGGSKQTEVVVVSVQSMELRSYAKDQRAFVNVTLAISRASGVLVAAYSEPKREWIGKFSFNSPWTPDSLEHRVEDWVGGLGPLSAETNSSVRDILEYLWSRRYSPLRVDQIVVRPREVSAEWPPALADGAFRPTSSPPAPYWVCQILGTITNVSPAPQNSYLTEAILFVNDRDPKISMGFYAP